MPKPGSATARWTAGQDMVAASLELGVDMGTGHWEFPTPRRVEHMVENDFQDQIALVAQNIVHVDSDATVLESFMMREQRAFR